MIAATTQYALFGPLTIRRGGETIACRGKTSRAVLATLLLHPGRPLDVTTLVRWVWKPERRPDRPDHAVQTHVMRLRRLVGPDAIATDGHGYHATADPDQIDVHRFEAKLRTADGFIRTNDYPDALRCLNSALADSRDGLPLPDLIGGPLGKARHAGLVEARLAARERRALLMLMSGRIDVAELELLALSEPFREIRWMMLVHGLYCAGQSVDALRCCQQAAQQLRAVGLSPGPSLLELERSVLDQKGSLHTLDMLIGRAASPIASPVGLPARPSHRSTLR